MLLRKCQNSVIKFKLTNNDETNEIDVYVKLCHILMSSLLILKEMFDGFLA